MSEAIKKKNLTVRFSEEEYNRLRRACHRDELKPALFAQEAILASLEKLLKRQETKGFKCMEAI